MSRITMYRRRNGDLAEAAGPELFLDVPESAESETKDFPSFQKIALAALRRSRPEIKNRMLVVWECRGPDPVDPVNVLLAFRHCGVEGHFAKPDSRNARMLACVENVREMAEWRAEILGDGLFRYETETRKPAQVMVPGGETGISWNYLTDGIVELSRQGGKERLWLVACERLASNLNTARCCFLVHEAGCHSLRTRIWRSAERCATPPTAPAARTTASR